MKKVCFLFLSLFLFLTVSPEIRAASVKIGILPIVDALPFYVTEQRNLYNSLPIPIQQVTFRSALERDAAFQTGKIDAYLGDLISAALLRSRGFPAKVISVILGKTPKEGLFAVLSPPNSSARTLQDLKGKQIAISSNTIIEYVLDGLLSAHGMTASDIRKQEIKSIPIRYQMLMSGKIDAALLPDPLASLARFHGAHWIADDGETNLSQTVLVWNETFLKKHPSFMKSFYKIYNKAVNFINKHHEDVRALLVKRCHLPKPIAETFEFADFPNASPPTAQEISNVLTWLKKKGLLNRPVSVEELLANPKYLVTPTTSPEEKVKTKQK